VVWIACCEIGQKSFMWEAAPTRMAPRPPCARTWKNRCGDVRRSPKCLAYRLVKDQKGSESRGRVGFHSPAGVWGRARVLGWPDSFRYLPITGSRGLEPIRVAD